MAIIKRHQDLRPFYSSLWDEFMNGETWPNNMTERRNMPALNAKEDEKNLTIELRVPGMKKENIKLDYNDGLLTITGQCKEEKEENEGEEKENKGKYLRREFSSYSFKRTIELPEEKYDVGQAKASYKDGILEITMPKKEEKEKLSKTIEVM